MRYHGILLDFYGTVVEEDDLVIRRIVRRITMDHPQWSERSLGELWGRTFSALLAAAWGAAFRTQRELELESLAAVLDRVGSTLNPLELSADQFAYWRSPQVHPDAADFLSTCPLPVCVISNVDRADLDAAIGHTGLPLPMSVTSEDARSYKPRAELFTRGLELLNLDSTRVLHIGDSLSSDIAGANALDIDVVWLNKQRRTAPTSARILHQCADLRGVLPILAAT